jgi:flagellar FliL protein
MSEPEAAAAAPAKKGKSKLLLIGVPVIVLLAGGGAGAWWYMGKSPDAAAAAAEPEPETAPGFITLDPVIVNLADPGGRRFLRISLRLVVKSEEEAKELEEKELVLLKARSAVLELLATQKSEDLQTPEGKTELKKQIAERATSAFGHAEVTDVLFAEFVVQ